MSTPPSNLKLRIGLSLASFTNYPQIDHSSKQTFANTTKYKQSFSSFLNFPNTHVYQLRVASLYKYEFWDSLQSITNRKETQDTAFWSNKDNWRTWVWVQLFPRQFEIKPWIERERERARDNKKSSWKWDYPIFFSCEIQIEAQINSSVLAIWRCSRLLSSERAIL